MKKIVLFLHGYGSNGNDLISLKDHISITTPIEFISPNAPEPCELNFFGYQWFALNERSFEELTMGLSSAFNYLDDIINDITDKYSVKSDQISIIGFSQGSMLATYYSLLKKTNFHSVVSLSGSLPDSILGTLTIADSKTKYLIFHGKLDDVVSYQQALQTHQFLESKNINNKIVLDDNCHHSISPLAIDEINLLYQDWL